MQDGRTALFCAARIQNKDIARLLIDIGAAVDQQVGERACCVCCFISTTRVLWAGGEEGSELCARGGNREFAALLTQVDN